MPLVFIAVSSLLIVPLTLFVLFILTIPLSAWALEQRGATVAVTNANRMFLVVIIMVYASVVPCGL
jgi:hypothetical protein